MRQHAIPQNILDIEFKLFSKFTIREFIYIALGVGLGSIFLFLFSAGRMPGILAVPIFAVFTGIGLFFGLVNINDQKADVYVKNFFVAITNPTQRVWKNKNFDEKFDEIKPIQGSNTTQGTMDRTIPIAQAPELVTVNPVKAQTEGFEDAIEEEEAARLSAISASIAQQTAETKAAILSQTVQPVQPIQPVQQVIAQPIPVPQLTEQPKSQAIPMQPAAVVPQNISVQPQPIRPVITPSSAPQATTQLKPIRLVIGSHNFSILKTEIPGIQRVPNNINILLCDKRGNAIDKSLVFIKDKDSKLIQAIMSDQNGYIITGKTYPNASYFVTIQKENYHFPEIEFILDGSVIEPIKIIPIA